jgi:hypothetical protein
VARLRVPAAWLLAAMIALSATTVYFYLGVVQPPIVPAYIDPPGGTYSVPAGGAAVAKVSGSKIDASANVTDAYVLYADYGALFVFNVLPQGTAVRIGDAWIGNVTEGRYIAWLDHNKYVHCAPASVTKLESGMYLAVPAGTTDYATAVTACEKFVKPVNYVWTGKVFVDTANNVTSVEVYNTGTGLVETYSLPTYKGAPPFSLAYDAEKVTYYDDASKATIYAYARAIVLMALVAPSANAQYNVTVQPGP